MKTLRYSLLVIAQLGLASMCFAAEPGTPQQGASQVSGSTVAGSSAASQADASKTSASISGTSAASSAGASKSAAAELGYLERMTAFAQEQYNNGLGLYQAGKGQYLHYYEVAPRKTVIVTAGALLAAALAIYGAAKLVEKVVGKAKTE